MSQKTTTYIVTVPTFPDEEVLETVEITIKERLLAERLGRKAIASKSGVAKILNGLVTVKHIRPKKEK